MKLWHRALNSLLLLCATGRVPKPGKLFRVSPFYSDTLVLHDFPNNGNSPYNCYRFSIDPKDNASFLVLDVQTDVPIWDQWIQVLYSRESSKGSELLIGWMPYTKFNGIVLVEWDQWEEEKEQ